MCRAFAWLGTVFRVYPRTGIARGSLLGMSVILCEQRIRLMAFPVKDDFGVGGARVGGGEGTARAMKRLYCAARASERRYHEGTHKGCPYGVWKGERCGCTSRGDGSRVGDGVRDRFRLGIITLNSQELIWVVLDIILTGLSGGGAH